MPKLPPKDYIKSVSFSDKVSLYPIGIIHSPYKERHGTPRQSHLGTAPSDYQPVIASIELFADIVPKKALKDMEGFEHIWVISVSYTHLRANETDS